MSPVVFFIRCKRDFVWSRHTNILFILIQIITILYKLLFFLLHVSSLCKYIYIYSYNMSSSCRFHQPIQSLYIIIIQVLQFPKTPISTWKIAQCNPIKSRARKIIHNTSTNKFCMRKMRVSSHMSLSYNQESTTTVISSLEVGIINYEKTI